MLPEGWVQVTHACGMPLYLNRQARVCTLSRPYFIGQSSARVLKEFPFIKLDTIRI